MNVFLWNQKEQHVNSRDLLKRAVLQYEALKQNTDEYRESPKDSLFEFTAEELGIRELPGGKPCVVDRNGDRLPVECSVTHTGDWWLCTVGSHPSGLDAELRSRAVNPALIRRICTEDERKWLDRAAELQPEGQNERLLWLWVRKEAYVKYLGTGIKEGFNTFSVFEVAAKGADGESCSFQTVDLGEISDEAAEQLHVAVYCREEIESVEWLK